MANFDPTPQQRVFGTLRPTAQDIETKRSSVTSLVWCCGDDLNDKSYGEVEMVEPRMLKLFQDHGGFSKGGQHAILGTIGFATSNSKPDAIHYGASERGLGPPRAFGEFKGAMASLGIARDEVFSHASRAACNQVEIGVPLDEIIVPAVVCNGTHFRVYAVFVLANFLPVRLPVSPELDLRIYDEAVEAMAYLAKLNAFTRTPLKSTGTVVSVSKMSYSLELYFEKVLTEDVLKRGLNLFGSYWEGRDHIMVVFSALYAHESAREHVVFPLAIRLPDKRPTTGAAPATPLKLDHIIIFDNLTHEKHGYKMGVPPFEHRAAFLALVKVIVGRFLEAGVVHGDLYPSNYMWRFGKDEQLEVKIIDWDTAHLLREGKFVDGYAAKLQDAQHPSVLNDNHDMKYVQAMEHCSLNKETWDLFVLFDGEEVVDARRRMNSLFPQFILQE